jgi:hypothetical protein
VPVPSGVDEAILTAAVDADGARAAGKPTAAAITTYPAARAMRASLSSEWRELLN